MTLTEVANMIYAADGDLAVYVFDDEDARDQYRNSTAPDGYLFAVASPYRLHAVLNEKYANAKVESVYLVNTTTVDVIIKLEAMKK